MKTSNRDVRGALLDAAQKLFQQRGYNAVSYYDLSRSVGVTTATIHYYFPTKADLATAAIQRYAQALEQHLQAISASGASPAEQLDQFGRVFLDTYHDEGRLCLGGMFAADLATLSPPTQEALRSFFLLAETWLAALLADGQRAGHFQLPDTPAQVAQSVLALLEGALLLARTYTDEQRLRATTGSIRRLIGLPAAQP